MIQKATRNDSRILAELAVQMWGSHTVEDLEAEFAETLCGENTVFFIKYVDGDPVGFAQCSLRSDYVEGTESSPVGYLEGIFLKQDFRKNGYARQLLAACENWAREKGCREFASDCELHNTDSLHFHLAVGFEEANRIICFKKSL